MGLGLVGSLLLIVVWCDTSLANEVDIRLRIKWVPIRQLDQNKQEISGWFPPDTNSVYHICRDHRGGGQNLGFFQKGGSCNVLVNMRREQASQPEALSFPPGTVSWMPMHDQDKPPPNLILAGFDSVDGEAIYVCRGMEKLSGRPKITPGHYKFSGENKCAIDHDGKGHLVDDFEMAFVSYYGIAVRAVAD